MGGRVVGWAESGRSPSAWARRGTDFAHAARASPGLHGLANDTPMARRELTFVGQTGGAAYGRWQGKCDACGEWNTIAEEGAATARPMLPGRAPRKGRRFALEPL